MDDTAAPLRRKLEEARRRWRGTRVLCAIAYAVAVVVALALICYHLDRSTPLRAEARELWDAVILLGGLLTSSTGITAAMLRRLPDIALAETVELRYPELRERLASTVNLVPLLASASAGTDPGFSMPMVASLAQETEQASESIDFRQAIDLGPLRRAGLTAVVALTLLVLHMLVAPAAFAVWIARMAHPGANIAPYASTRLWLTAKGVIARGAGLSVDIMTRGQSASSCTLHYRQEGDAADAWKTVATTFERSEPTGVRRFGYRFPGVSRDLLLYATANDGRSDEHRIAVEDLPSVLSVRLTLHFPAYMHRALQSLVESTGNIVAPFGTDVDVEVAANKPLRAAEVRRDSGPASAWKVWDAAIFGRLAIRSNGAYSLRITDRSGFTNPTPLRYDIRALPDQAPTVQINHPAADIDLVPEGATPLIAHASDDYGVNSMHLVFRAQRTRSMAGKLVTLNAANGAFAMPGPTGAPQADARIRWSIAGAHSLPGDTIRYEVDAWDNDAITGPHIGRSSAYRIHVVSLAEMQRRLKDQLDEEARALAQIHDRERDAHLQTQKARQGTDARALAHSLDAQNAITQETLTLAERAAHLSDDLENNNLASRSELRTRDEAIHGLQDLAAGQMPRASQSLQSAQDPAVRGNSLSRAEREQNAIQRDIERIQSLLARHQDTQKLADVATELALRQKELATSAENLAENARALRQTATTPSQDDLKSQREGMDTERERQSDTNSSTRRLEHQLKEAADAARDRGQKEIAGALTRAAEALRQGRAQSNQEQAQGALERNDPATAAPAQDRAAQALQRAAEAAREAAEQGHPETAQAAGQHLEQAARRLGELANRQQRIADRTDRDLTSPQSSRLAAQQRALEQQANGVQSSLQSSPSAEQSLQEARQSMGQSGAKLAQGSSGAARSPAHAAAHQLKKAADQAAAAARQMRQQQAAGELQQRVEYLAQIEYGLHSVTQRLDAQQRRDPLTDEQQQDLAQVAARQTQVEHETRELAGKMPSPSFQETLGIAAGDMAAAGANLNEQPRDTGQETQAAEQRAARMLEAVASALKQQSQSGGDSSGQSGESGSAQQAQQASTLGDLSLAHALEQQLREGTGALEEDRLRNAEQKLTSSQQRQAHRLTSLQHATRDITRRASDDLATSPQIQQETEMASGEMGQAEERLSHLQTGRPAQSAQEAAISHLDQAIKLVQDSNQQQQQQQQQQSAGQQGTPQPVPSQSGQGGQSPVMRLQAAPRSSLTSPDPRAGRLAPLSPRGQRTLREGQQERVPAEFQDAVSRYYRSLSTQKP